MSVSKSKKVKVEQYDNTLERALGERWVSMSNALTRAGHGLTLSEKRIIACAVSKLDSKKAVKAGAALVSKITASEYAETFNVDADTAYDQLQAGSKSLYNRSISFYEASYRRAGKDLAKVQMRWVGKVVYHEGEGWVELAWWNDLIPHLTGLQRQFTSYQLQQASALRSAYSWRLLELITRFESTGWAEYDITDFAASMDAPPSLTADFGQMKRRIVEPAVKELVVKDNWSIDWSTVKKGKKVTAIRFKFERNKQQRLL